jgi:hypothetical protein
MNWKRIVAEIQKHPRPLTEAEVAGAVLECDYGQMHALYLAGTKTDEQAERMRAAMRVHESKPR